MAFGRLPLFWLLTSVFWILLPAEIIDRIVISVGNQVITESQIEEEIRITAFLNRAKLDLNSAEKKKAAARLIEQTLVKREMDFSRYPMPSLSDADASLKSVNARFANEALRDDAVRQYGVTEEALRTHLWWQLTVLRFIEYRFSPGIQVSDAEVQAHYQRQVAKWRELGMNPIPTLEEAHDQIAEILTQQRIDEGLERWLVETRKQVTIRYRDETLQ